MTDQPELPPEVVLRDQAKIAIEADPGVVPGAQVLPPDVENGHIEDDPGT